VRPEVYFPFTVLALADQVVVLAEGSPLALAGAVRRQVYAVDREQPTMMKTMQELLDEYMLSEPRFSLVLFSVFAAIGLTLAVVGVYGVMSSAVSRRTQEIGLRMILARALVLVFAGIGIGLAAGYAAARVMQKQMWRVSPFDPLSFAAVSVLLLVVGVAAAYWPARRASRLDPTLALRYE
jgi:putative ABC transport system permease protein